jgi:hypothetical protein
MMLAKVTNFQTAGLSRLAKDDIDIIWVVYKLLGWILFLRNNHLKGNEEIKTCRV